MPVPRPRPRLAFEILFAWSLAAVSLQAEPAAVVSGELESADYIHRTGQFRRTDSGQLVDFALPPGGFILHLNAEADLRDVPLGTFFHFYFFVDQEREGTTRVDLSSMCDQFTHDDVGLGNHICSSADCRSTFDWITPQIDGRGPGTMICRQCII